MYSPVRVAAVAAVALRRAGAIGVVFFFCARGESVLTQSRNRVRQGCAGVVNARVVNVGWDDKGRHGLSTGVSLLIVLGFWGVRVVL